MTWLQAFLLFIGKRQRYRVTGDSMSPFLQDGDEVLLVRISGPKTGDVVVAKHPYKRTVKILKRVSRIDRHGAIFLLGDNPTESTDSRTFGAVQAIDICGKVVCKR